MDIFEYIDRVKANFDKQPEPRYNTKKYFMGGLATLSPEAARSSFRLLCENSMLRCPSVEQFALPKEDVHVQGLADYFLAGTQIVLAETAKGEKAKEEEPEEDLAAAAAAKATAMDTRGVAFAVLAWLERKAQGCPESRNWSTGSPNRG